MSKKRINKMLFFISYNHMHKKKNERITCILYDMMTKKNVYIR